MDQCSIAFDGLRGDIAPNWADSSVRVYSLDGTETEKWHSCDPESGGRRRTGMLGCGHHVEATVRQGSFSGRSWGVGLMAAMTEPDPAPEDHSGLILAIAARKDRASFSRLFLHFAPRLKAHLMRLGADPGQGEEIAQEALLAVWRKSAQFDPNRASAATWIFTIARNLWIDQLRKARRQDQICDVPWEGEAPEIPDAALEVADSTRSVREALDALPFEQSEVIRLSYFEGIPHADIAEKLSLPLGTVKSRIRLASARLRALLEERL
jgi:RNA polymerase sigma-70 factor (ECF subfamily)